MWSTATDGWIRRAPGGSAPFRRGDVDADGRASVTDAVRVVQALFGILPAPFDCDDALDVDDDGKLSVTDAISVLGYLFRGGTEPPAPFDACGEDPTPDLLACEETRC